MQKFKSLLKTTAIECLGSLLIAAGIYNFAACAGFPLSGFSGIALMLNRFFQIPIGLSTILLNIPVAVLCFRLLGRGFFLRSLRCMLLSSLMTDYLAPLFPAYAGSRLLAAICTGVFAGLGYAIIYMENSSTGGLDFITMAIKAKKPHLSLGNITFVLDFFIVLGTGLLYRDVDGIIYGMMINFLLAAVVDKAMYGANAGKMLMVVTSSGPRICQVIEETCHRGSTLIKAAGGYQQKDRDMIVCACSNKQMYKVQKAVKKADPASFLIILESHEVHGEGFITNNPAE